MGSVDGSVERGETLGKLFLCDPLGNIRIFE